MSNLNDPLGLGGTCAEIKTADGKVFQYDISLRTQPVPQSGTSTGSDAPYIIFRKIPPAVDIPVILNLLDNLAIEVHDIQHLVAQAMDNSTKIANDATTAVGNILAKLASVKNQLNVTPVASPMAKNYGTFGVVPPYYVKETNVSLSFTPGPDFPPGGNVRFQTYSNVSKKIEAVLMAPHPSPFPYSATSLNSVTDGDAVIQAVILDSKNNPVQTVSIETIFANSPSGTPNT